MVFHQTRVHVFGVSTLVLSNTAKNTHFTDPCSTKSHRPTTSPEAEMLEAHALSVHVELVEWTSACAGPLPSHRASFRQEVKLTTHPDT